MTSQAAFDFGSDQVVRAIRELAEADALTVVVGAGASMESGLPSWPTLLERLLLPLAKAQGLSKPLDQQAFIHWLLEREGLVGAAVIAEAALGEAFLKELREALYRGIPTPAPGPTARAIARLRRQCFDADAELVTTNYDDLLELALRSSNQPDEPPLEVISLVDASEPETGTTPVRHLHGLMTPKVHEGTVVLSEAHYHRMQDGQHWQEQFMADRLRSSSCLFIGTSLNDPNLLRYLYRQEGTARSHVACFARQQDAIYYDRATRTAALAREKIASLRWEEAGTSALRMDHFWEIAQLVWEVSLARQQGVDYEPYPLRAQQWQSAIARSVLTKGKLFAEIQDSMQGFLDDIAAWVKDRLEDANLTSRRERLGCSLWVYRPSSGSLTNWFSSDRAWRNPGTLSPVKADWRTNLTATRAFCEGRIVWDDTSSQAATRWNYVVGVPLYLEDRDRGRLPVGAMTLHLPRPLVAWPEALTQSSD
jgi:hypothetical protein